MNTSSRILFALLLAVLPACKTMEYAEDAMTITEDTIATADIGFNGYRLSPPPGYEIVTERPSGVSAMLWQMNLNLQRGILASEGLHYHFHRSFLFSNGQHVIVFIPFQNRNVRQFLHVPDDIKEEFLVDWMRKAGFSMMIGLEPTMEVETNRKDQAVLSLKTETPKNGAHFGQRVLTGYLNELYLFGGYAVSTRNESFQQDLDRFVASLEVIR